MSWVVLGGSVEQDLVTCTRCYGSLEGTSSCNMGKVGRH